MENSKKVTPKKQRKWWFRLLKQIMKVRYSRPAFIYLGEQFSSGAIILSNHEGTDAPMSLEIYNPAPIRMWGAHEMNSGLVKMYKYQTQVYYHEKKGWNLHLARLFCLIATPLTNLFYKGLNLISTYRDSRLRKTIRESISAIEEGQNIVIYPEDSTNGYLEQLEGFHAGFVLLCESLKKKGIDVPIFVTYFKKNDKVYVVDKPILYSQLSAECATKEEIAGKLVARCNELGQMQFTPEFIDETIEKNIQHEKQLKLEAKLSKKNLSLEEKTQTQERNNTETNEENELEPENNNETQIAENSNEITENNN